MSVNFPVSSFYPKRRCKRLLEIEIKLERGVAEAKKKPLPPRLTSSLQGHPADWKIFHKQAEALEYAKQRGSGLMTFSFEEQVPGSEGRRKYVVTHPTNMWKNHISRPPDQRCSYEVIPAESQCKLYFDLEFNKLANPMNDGNKMVQTLLEACSWALEDVYNLQHLIMLVKDCNIPNIDVNDQRDLFVKNDKGESVSFCDLAVYTKNRNFRLFLASKFEKKVPLLIAKTNRYIPDRTRYNTEDWLTDEAAIFSSSLITYFGNGQQLGIQEEKQLLTFGNKQPGELASANSNNNTTQVDLAKNPSLNGYKSSPWIEVDRFIMELIAPAGTIRQWIYFEKTETIVYHIYGNRFCSSIGREHKRNHIKKREAAQGLRSSPLRRYTVFTRQKRGGTLNMRSWWNLPAKLQHEDHMEESDSTVTLTGAENECTKLSDSGGAKYGSVVHLSPSRIGNVSWWKKRKERILRKKTLLMRVPILQWLPNYSTNDFVADLVAGITIGITVIPQALAYATIGGLPPEYGLYSAYMGCFVYVFLGSTRAVTIGPTALLGLLTHDGASLMGPEAAVLLAFLTGCISLLFGIFNFGFLIEFIAAPVIAGFTTAAALTIGTTQISSLLGLKFQADGFVQTWQAVFEHIQETQTWDAVMGFSSIAILLALRLLEKVRIGKDGDRTSIQCFINGAFWLVSVSRNAIVIIVGCVIAATLIKSGLDAPFEITGNITGGLPSIQAPSFYIEYGNQTYNFVEICQNLGSALFVTPLIAILESMAIAKSFAKGQRIDASQEMIAIGTSNLLGSFVSSFPVSGSFSRTAVNNASGVRTAFGGIYTGALVLLAITVLTPYFFFIPKSCLAAVIITAVIFMVEVHLVKLVWKSRTRPRIKILTFQDTSDGFGNQIKYLYITPDRSVVFTAIDYFMSTVRKASALYPGVPVVIDLSYVSIADFSTAYGFDNLAEDLHKRGHSVVITRAHPRVLTILEGVRGSKLHVHRDGVDLDVLLQDLWSTCAITGKNLKDIGNDTTHVPISSK
ncbi:hypothetical protein GHT06_020619 [Daphnia sinensis]|uniref:STAS domain-containing protein n=1 Tax=Daphnia sinensis TaxID=1820382 RepID=A0AAD5KI23_9CRUS|nr:hypothetical protein GHT06_020619 [Daphnia sinensis]